MKIIRTKQLCQLLSISRSTLWRLERTGSLPASFFYSARAKGWLEHDIDEWIKSRKQT